MNVIHSLKERMFIMTTKIDFINGNTKRCLMAMALPMIAAMFLNMMYNLVDSLWIGNLLGETAYAALTNSTPVILVLTSVAMGATNGVSILISQAVGAKDRKKTESLVATSFCVAVVFAILVTVLLEVFLPGILNALNTPAETYEMAYSYLSIYILGYLTVYLYLYFTAVLRSFGNSMFQAVAMLVSTILNAILDPIFIHFIGFHGAAVATLLSQMICLLFMLIYLKKKKLFAFKISAFDRHNILPFIQKAVPSVIQQSIPAISTTFLTALVSTYSVTVIAAYGVTGKLETILFYPAMALNTVLTTIIGQCVGGARYDRAKDYLKCALGYGCGLLVILSALVVGFSKQLSGLFVKSSDVAVIVGTYFLIVSIGYVLNTVTNCYLGTLNGMGKPSKSMFLMIFYYIVVRMPLAYLLSYLGFGLNGIWAAVLISHVIACITAFVTGTLIIKKNGKGI
jgi:putative MATE family efflux protein